MKRKILHHCFQVITGLCALVSCLLLVGIIGYIAVQGGSAFSWKFLTGVMAKAGAAGGIFYHLSGTLILIATALIVCAPLSLGIALVQCVYLKNIHLRGAVKLFLYLLNGIPTILIGIVGMVVFVHWLDWGKSWLAGGILLGIMILPTATVTLIERIAGIPGHYLEAASGIGLSQSQIVRSVILPQSIGGFVTGHLLGLARAAGETAPIMFTATIFSGATFPSGIKESPVLSLPYHIFILAQDSYDTDAKTNLWAAALVLVILVFTLSLLALPTRLKIQEEVNYG